MMWLPRVVALHLLGLGAVPARRLARDRLLWGLQLLLEALA